MYQKTLLHTYRGHTDMVLDIAWTPDGNFIASSGTDQTVHVWEPKQGKTIYIYQGHASWVGTVSWSPDGKQLASGGFNAALQEHQMHVWDAFTGKVVTSYGNFWGEIGCVAWMSHRQYIAIGAWDTTVHIYNVTRHEGNRIYQFNSNPGYVYAVSWSFDGAYLVCASDVVVILKQNDGVWVPHHTYGTYRHHIFDAKCSPGTYVIAISNGSMIEVRSIFTDEITCTYGGHTNTIRAIAWSPDGRCIASAGDDKTVQIWNARSGQHLLTYEGYVSQMSALAWSPAGTRIAFAGENGTIQIWQSEIDE